ncbi:MAG: hypothetical protein GWM87_04595 [Xanthomonadales bacterium]|nr:hypothetical protein [Xanthomonadales bacterium]NIX12288.1 hypothetical protein [Xanthomonadales bacterium]
MQADAADELVAFANRIAEDNPEADLWEIADGILSGAVHWWLFANAPCDDPRCEDCESIRTAELRMKTLRDLIARMAEDSEYYHSPNDENVAHA